MKVTFFLNNDHTNIIISDSDVTPEECKENLKSFTILQFQKNKVSNSTSYNIYSSEQTLPRHMHAN